MNFHCKVATSNTYDPLHLIINIEENFYRFIFWSNFAWYFLGVMSGSSPCHIHVRVRSLGLILDLFLKLFCSFEFNHFLSGSMYCDVLLTVLSSESLKRVANVVFSRFLVMEVAFSSLFSIHMGITIARIVILAAVFRR